MEKVIYSILNGDSEFHAAFPTLYERGAVPDKPIAPFAVYALVGTPRQGRAYPRLPRLEVWLYDNRGDYSKINAGLERVDELLLDIAHVYVDDQHVAQADPQGWSGYLYDDIYRANTRNAAYLVIGSGG